MACALLLLAADVRAEFPTTIPTVADDVILLPDGSLLFNDNYAGGFARLLPNGDAERITLPVPQTRNPTLGADARIWFTIDSIRQVGRWNPATGDLDTFVMPANISGAIGQMALGLDGSLWATATDSDRILKITPSGVMSTYDIQSYDPQPVGIALGADGNMWFAERGSKKIARITPAGAITEFAVQYPMTTGPSQIVRGPDDSVWFASDDGFGRVALNGEMQLFVTGPQAALGRLVLAPDGSFWLTTGDSYVTRFTPPAKIERTFLWDQPAHSAGLVFDRTGSLFIVDSQLRNFSRLARLANAGSNAGNTAVVEFFNGPLQHYFITANAEEAAGIDAGSAGPGWTRTGETWRAWIGAAVPGATEVCRFYGNPAIDPATGARRGPNSHFYTFVGAECTQVLADPGWLYEAANRFQLVEPAGGQCPSGLTAIRRTYNNRFAQNDSNHRYTVKGAIYDQMVASGWKGEGVVMCAAP